MSYESVHWDYESYESFTTLIQVMDEALKEESE